MRSGAIIVGALLTELALGRPAAAQNLLLNNSFGTDSFANWNLTSSGTTTGAAVVIATDNVARNYPTGAYNEAIPNDTLTAGSPNLSSGYAAYFTTDTGSQTLSQSLTLSAGTYSIGFDLFVPTNGYANPNDATFSGSIAGTPLLSSASVANIGKTDGVAKWVTVDGSATVTTAGTYQASFTFTGSAVPAKDILVDRVFVVAGNVTNVPEPAALPVFGLALAALAAARRHRRG